MDKKTKEEKKVETETTNSEEEETNKDTEAEGSEEETEEESEVESEEEEDSNIDIDYKAEAEKERKAREKAEKAAADSAFKLREEKRKHEEEVDDEDEDDKPLTRKDLDAALDKDRKEQTMSKAIEIASNISGSGDEADLVMEVYKSRTFPAHLTLEQKLQEAYLIANAPKIIGQNAELKRALKGKNLSSKNTAGTHHDKPKSSEPNVSNADKTVLQQVGFKWNGTNRRWEKKLNNGQTLVREKNREGKWATRPLSN